MEHTVRVQSEVCSCHLRGRHLALWLQLQTLSPAWTQTPFLAASHTRLVATQFRVLIMKAVVGNGPAGQTSATWDPVTRSSAGPLTARFWVHVYFLVKGPQNA